MKLKVLIALTLILSGFVAGYFGNYQIKTAKTATVPTAKTNINQPSSLPDLIVLNQLFNNGNKFPLSEKQTLNFSDLITLEKLFQGQTNEIFDSLGTNGNNKLQDLMILNQLFNGGKKINITANNEELKNLMFLYFIFHK